jgi:hypothetical protein
MNPSKPPLSRPPLFMLIFMSMFGFIGLSLLVFIWTQTDRNFPPLIFKLVASFIALAFMAMGFGGPLSALLARNRPGTPASSPSATAPPVKGYQCPHCGAGLGPQEVSPSGDVKCSYCQKWWNIHTA